MIDMFKTKYIFPLLYLFIGVTPYLDTADKIVPQTLFLNIINLSSIISIIYFKKSLLDELKSSIKNIPFILYFLFFIWSSITIIFSINISESLSVLTEIFTLMVTFCLLIYYLSQVKDLENFLFTIIFSLLSIEIITVIAPFIREIYESGSPTERGQIYRGYTGNINILAYVMLIKLPFVIYFQIIGKANKVLSFLLILFVTYIITSIFATRSAILALVLLIILTISFFYYIRITSKKNYNYKKYSNILKITLFPFVLGLILNNFSSYVFKSKNLQDRLSTLTEINSDTSLSQRLTYYIDAFESFTEKPFFGKGIGTWEVESIDYVKKDLKNYIVPYHAHNDFLEILAETGLPGMVLYFGIIFYVLFKLLKVCFDQNSRYKTRIFAFSLACALIIYLIDSMFNFPFARIIQQVFLLFLIAISIIFLDLNNRSYKFINFVPLILLLILPASIYSSSRLFISSKHQKIFLQQFNRNDFSIPSLETIDKFELRYKSLSATALPMSTFKGIYYVRNGKYREAIPLFHQGMKDNPYLHINESFLGFTYLQLEMLDSSLYYSKIAYDNSPNIAIHFGHYLLSLVEAQDSIKIKEIFTSIDPSDKESYHEEGYLQAIAAVTNPENNTFALEGLDINIESGNDALKKGYYTLKVGAFDMYNADKEYQTGLYFFEQENFKSAAEFFIKADKLNPYELVYKENAANALLKIGEDEKALILLNDLIDNYNSSSPKAHYLRGLTLYSMGKKDEGCIDLKYAYDQNLISDTRIYQIACLEN